MARTPIAAGIVAAARTQADIDDYIALDQAPAYIPGRPHRCTVWRWESRGIRRGGEIIRLQTIMVGGRRFTTRLWIDEFLAACNGEAAPTASPGRRQRQAAAAMTMLAEMGVGSTP